MEVPKGVEQFGSGEHYWRLQKALYGLKQAGRQWKKRLHEVSTNLGLTHSYANDCLYIKRERGEITLLVLVYVNDMAVSGPNSYEIISFKTSLSEDFDITDLGKLKLMLGILITRDHQKQLIYLNQSAYISQVFSCFGLQDTTPVVTPLTVKHSLLVTQSPQSKAKKQAYKNYAGNIHFLSLVGSLLFATQTQPDIQFAVSLVAQFGGNPGIAHLEAAKHILCYLKGTTNLNLVLGRQSKSRFDLVGWTDSNWAQDPDDHQSTGDFAFDVGGGIISWLSKKQPIIAMLSVEAEYIASANATKEAIWLLTLLNKLNFPQNNTTIIYTNNQGCIALAHNPISHS